jgi:plasmid stabilization system protein ParE
MYKVRYSVQAEEDLHDAIDYIAKESVSVALNYLKGYEDNIELLQSNPLMGISCRSKCIEIDCRILIYKSHLIIYRINCDTNEILIIRVYHHTKDYINDLKKKKIL